MLKQKPTKIEILGNFIMLQKGYLFGFSKKLSKCSCNLTQLELKMCMCPSKSVNILNFLNEICHHFLMQGKIF